MTTARSALVAGGAASMSSMAATNALLALGAMRPRCELPRVKARRPHGNRGLAGCDRQDAAADAALSGKAHPVSKFAGAVIVAATALMRRARSGWTTA
jgi:hypothetical protein